VCVKQQFACSSKFAIIVYWVEFQHIVYCTSQLWYRSANNNIANINILGYLATVLCPAVTAHPCAGPVKAQIFNLPGRALLCECFLPISGRASSLIEPSLSSSLCLPRRLPLDNHSSGSLNTLYIYPEGPSNRHVSKT
jgi:hypothetical protein